MTKPVPGLAALPYIHKHHPGIMAGRDGGPDWFANSRRIAAELHLLIKELRKRKMSKDPIAMLRHRTA